MSKRWTSKDEEMLRYFYTQTPFDLQDLAELLGRSEKAVEKRIKEMEEREDMVTREEWFLTYARDFSHASKGLNKTASDYRRVMQDIQSTVNRNHAALKGIGSWCSTLEKKVDAIRGEMEILPRKGSTPYKGEGSLVIGGLIAISMVVGWFLKESFK